MGRLALEGVLPPRGSRGGLIDLCGFSRRVISRAKLHLADALGQAALQFPEFANLFAMVVTTRGRVPRFAVISDQIAGIFSHDISSFYRAFASI